MTSMRACVNRPTAKLSQQLWRCWICLFLATFAHGATATSEPFRQVAPKKRTPSLFGPSLHPQPTASVAVGHFPATVSKTVFSYFQELCKSLSCCLQSALRREFWLVNVVLVNTLLNSELGLIITF